MDNRNISLILSDLDGTLFHNDKSISAYSKQIIAEVQKRGILFGVCTSRAKVNAVKFLDGIQPDILITNGGGLVTVEMPKQVRHDGDDGRHDDNGVIYSCEFTVEEIRALIKTTFEVCGPDAVLSVDNDHGLYCNTKEELGDRYWTSTDFSDFNHAAMKICFETLDRQLVEKIASSIGIDKIDFLPFSDIPWYKMSKKNATKEKAIEKLSQHLNLPVENIAAFGDDFSDIGMLKICGRGIAMENAIDEVKSIADEICPSNEDDGVARWMENQFEL